MVAEYPKKVGTTGQWPRGADLCYILAGVLWTQSQRFHSAHAFLVGSRSGCYFWTYSKYPPGISGVPLPNLIHSSFHINLKHTKIQLHNIHSSTLNYFRIHLTALVNCLLLSIYMWLGVISCLLVIISSCYLLFTIVKSKILKNVPFNTIIILNNFALVT